MSQNKILSLETLLPQDLEDEASISICLWAQSFERKISISFKSKFYSAFINNCLWDGHSTNQEKYCGLRAARMSLAAPRGGRSSLLNIIPASTWWGRETPIWCLIVEQNLYIEEILTTCSRLVFWLTRLVEFYMPRRNNRGWRRRCSLKITASSNLNPSMLA